MTGKLTVHLTLWDFVHVMNDVFKNRWEEGDHGRL